MVLDTPSFFEVRMVAEINSYESDFDREPDF